MPVRELTFRDADFPYRFAWCRSKLEGKSLRWIPYGMPRLSHHFSHSVFLLFGKDENAPPDQHKLKGPSGSGVIIQWAERDLPHYYAVTAAHVVKGGADVVMLNTKAGTNRPIDLDISEWVYKLEWEDLAIADITDRLTEQDQFSCVPAHKFVNDRFIKRVELGIGEDGFMLGLFTGKKQQSHRNEIASRFGNISLLADIDNPVRHGFEIKPNGSITITSPCHVFDMHSRPGFSGSPVFVYRTPGGDLRSPEQRKGKRVILLDKDTRFYQPDQEQELIELDYDNNQFMRLLGIHVAQFHDKVKIKKKKPPKQKIETEEIAMPETADDILRDEDTIEFQGSMTIVVPADRILELLEHPDLVRQRKHRTDRFLNAREDDDNMPVPETAVVTEPVADNPSAKEDFTSLLNAAARSNKPAS